MKKIILMALIVLMTTGCSVQFEIGYHGRTGRDDQKVTESFKGVR